MNVGSWTIFSTINSIDLNSLGLSAKYFTIESNSISSMPFSADLGKAYLLHHLLITISKCNDERADRHHPKVRQSHHTLSSHRAILILPQPFDHHEPPITVELNQYISRTRPHITAHIRQQRVYLVVERARLQIRRPAPVLRVEVGSEVENGFQTGESHLSGRMPGHFILLCVVE